MTVQSTRQWEVFGGAPYVFVRGPNLFAVQAPRSSRTFPLQQPADSAPFAFARGLPYSAPLFGPSGSPLVISSGQQDIFSSPAPVFFRGTPAKPTVPQGISTGSRVFAHQHSDPAATYGDIGPYTWTNSTVPLVKPSANTRGSAIFTIANDSREDKAPEVWLRSTIGIPTLNVIASPAFRASFQRAGGWWDLLSDAPFFFAAGYALQPPGPPPMKAIAEQQPDSSAAFKWTGNTLQPPPNLPVSVTDFAFAPQHIPGEQPWTSVRGFVPPPKPTPPLGSIVLTRQLEADRAAYTYASGLYTTTAFTPGALPPRGRTALTSQQPFDAAPYAMSRFVIPFIGNIPPRGSTTIPPQHSADTAPFVLTRNLPLQFSAVPPKGSQVLTRALEADTAPFSWARGLVFLTPVHIAGAVFAKLHDDAIAPFVWTRDRAIKPFIPTPIPGMVFVPVEKDSTSGSPIVLARSSIILPNPNRPISLYTFGFAQEHPDYQRSPFVFLQPALLWETVPFVGGLLVQQAVFNLVNAGLEVFIQYAYDPVVQYGYVISQSPPAGTVLPPWTVVTITASEGLPPAPGVLPVSVPDLTGMTAYAADSAIFDARLSIGQYTWVINNATPGTVVAQSPPPGAQVAAGTIVTLTLSLGPIPPPQQVVSPQ